MQIVPVGLAWLRYAHTTVNPFKIHIIASDSFSLYRNANSIRHFLTQSAQFRVFFVPIEQIHWAISRQISSFRDKIMLVCFRCSILWPILQIFLSFLQSINKLEPNKTNHSPINLFWYIEIRIYISRVNKFNAFKWKRTSKAGIHQTNIHIYMHLHLHSTYTMLYIHEILNILANHSENEPRIPLQQNVLYITCEQQQQKTLQLHIKVRSSFSLLMIVRYFDETICCCCYCFKGIWPYTVFCFFFFYICSAWSWFWILLVLALYLCIARAFMNCTRLTKKKNAWLLLFDVKTLTMWVTTAC